MIEADAASVAAPTEPTIKMAEFHVKLASGTIAIVVLPIGLTALDMLSLIAQLPEIGGRASTAGRNALDRILVPRR